MMRLATPSTWTFWCRSAMAERHSRPGRRGAGHGLAVPGGHRGGGHTVSGHTAGRNPAGQAATAAAHHGDRGLLRLDLRDAEGVPDLGPRLAAGVRAVDRPD